MRPRAQLSLIVAAACACLGLTAATALATPKWAAVHAPWTSPNTNNIFAGPPADITNVPNTSTIWTAGGFEYGYMAPIDRLNASGWKLFGASLFDCCEGTLQAITATAGGQIWTVGWETVENTHPYASVWNGSAWQDIPVEDGASIDGGHDAGTQMFGIAIANPNSIWAVGEGPLDTQGRFLPLVETYTGPTYGFLIDHRYDPGYPDDGSFTDATNVLGTGQVWAVGWANNPYTNITSPLIQHYTGTMWQTETLPTTLTGSLNAVTAISATNAWAVGGNLIMHWNGTTWSATPTPASVGTLSDIGTVPGTTHMWAVGSRPDGASLTLFWNGSAWKAVNCPNIGQLVAVTAISATNAWAVSQTSSLHYH
jgi:hypothetical protein